MRGIPFQKGQSGNPRGRPRVAADVRAEARRFTKEAVHRLVELMRQDDDRAVAVRAAEALLDRAHGRPAQALAIGIQDLGDGRRSVADVIRSIEADDNRRVIEGEARQVEEFEAAPLLPLD